MRKFIQQVGLPADVVPGKKILFANFPADGHFNPLTGLAVHLKGLGYDVRWYSSNTYRAKLKNLGIQHYPFKTAIDVESNNFDKAFPERTKKKGQIAKLKFDIINAFILRGPEYYADIIDIYREFPFDLMIADCAFTGIPFVKEKMNIPVISMGILPLGETSRDLPPSGLGLEPSYTFFGKIKQALLRKVADLLIFREPNRVMRLLFNKYDIPHNNENLFDMMVSKSTLLLQSGTPGFEYHRSDLSQHVRFIGALLPYTSHVLRDPWFDERLNKYSRVVLVTQGTVEKDVEKLIVPTLEAFKGTDTLVVATTGGSGTEDLNRRFPEENLIIRDFIPFSDIMPYADAYITNGGYGGVMLGIENELPMVVAGVHEGKNEINARVGYFKLGVNLKTEKPSSEQVANAVNLVLADNSFRENVKKLAYEFSKYNPQQISAQYVADVLMAHQRVFYIEQGGEKIY